MAERRRSRNFSVQEKERLLQLVVDHKDAILNKNMDEAAQLAKNMAWDSLTYTFNSTGEEYRNKTSLIRLWEKLKHKSKMYYNISLRYRMQAVEGPYGVYGPYGPCGPFNMKTDPILKRVCNILSQHNATQNNTSAEPETVPATSQTITAEANKQDYVGRTPWWSTSPPPPVTDRTDGHTSFCNCFQDMGDKNERIQETKYHMLQEELHHKRRLHRLTLQAAEKEVQIKTEILLQIKNGFYAHNC